MNPIFSVITINYNNVEGLRNTMKSVSSQTFSDFEYIVIDGGSTDGSLDVIREFQTFNSDIDQGVTRKYQWISEPDSGIYNAMNKGIFRSTGDYCLFLNSGDVLFNNHVLSQIAKNEIISDIICFDAIVNEEHKNTLVKAPKDVSFYTFYTHTILHQATLIKRFLFEKYGLYNEQFRIVSDWEFFVKALILGNCSYQSIELTISVFDSNGVSSNSQYIELCRAERQQVFDKYLAYFIPDYNLIQPKPIYNFLKNAEKFRILKYPFLFIFKVINKIITIFS
jgi:glycosyltransferase involved in cell wall biosynthesis